jgi:hypothetical protein
MKWTISLCISDHKRSGRFFHTIKRCADIVFFIASNRGLAPAVGNGAEKEEKLPVLANSLGEQIAIHVVSIKKIFWGGIHTHMTPVRDGFLNAGLR